MRSKLEGGGLAFTRKDAVLHDRGGVAEAQAGGRCEVAAMVELVRIKRWREVEPDGPPPFKRALMTQLLRERIDVTIVAQSDEDRPILAQARRLAVGWAVKTKIFDEPK